MNKIRQWLDDAGLPWRKSRGELGEQFGITRCSWSTYDTVLIGIEPPPLPFMLRPFSFWHEPRFAADLPPLSISAHVWQNDDARRNLDIVHTALTHHLGAASPDNSSNTFGWRWRDGAASVSIICWPPRLQQHYGTNHWHEREPRLKTACSVTIDTGFRLACSPTELIWLEQAQPVFILPVSPLDSWFSPPPPPPRGLLSRFLGKAPPPPSPPSIIDSLAALRVSEPELAYVRQPPPFIERLHGGVFLSGDRAMIAFGVGQLKILPLADVQTVRLDTIAPSRGSGRKIIELACRRANSPDSRCTIMTSGYQDDLEQTAEALAQLIARPLVIDHCLDD